MSEKVLKLCVLGRESLTLDTHSKPLLPEGVEGEVNSGVYPLQVLALYIRDHSWEKYVLGSWQIGVPYTSEEGI